MSPNKDLASLAQDPNKTSDQFESTLGAICRAVGFRQHFIEPLTIEFDDVRVAVRGRFRVPFVDGIAQLPPAAQDFLPVGFGLKLGGSEAIRFLNQRGENPLQPSVARKPREFVSHAYAYPGEHIGSLWHCQ